MKHFKAPKKTLKELDVEAAATLIAVASDVALILDSKACIRDMAFSSAELSHELEQSLHWLGKSWLDTVTVESREKITGMLAEAEEKTVSGWRQMNHPSSVGGDVPILYSVVKVRPGHLVALGRDLRPIAQLQQRLIETQQSMERDYARLRHIEMRYRLLFDGASEALLIVDAGSLRILESNPAAAPLLDVRGKRAGSRNLLDMFDAATRNGVQALVNDVRASGQPEVIQARLLETGETMRISASLLRNEGVPVLLMRVLPIHADNGALASRSKVGLLKLAETGPDASVVTDSEGRILVANAAFLDMTHLPTEQQARGEILDRWLGRPGIDLDVLMSSLRRHGSVRIFATTLRSDGGTPADVEVSAAKLLDGDQLYFGFTIRMVNRRTAGEARGPGNMHRSSEQLKELIGRVPLKELVRDSTDMIERLCIEAALELTNDNRASAAEMLGLSRQSLYLKLRRHGLIDFSPDADREE